MIYLYLEISYNRKEISKDINLLQCKKLNLIMCSKNIEVNMKENIVNNISELAINKQLNFLIGSGVSFPAIPLMNMVKGDNIEEKNDNLLMKIMSISKELLKNDNFDTEILTTYNNYYSFIYEIIKLLYKSNSRLVPRCVNIFTTNYDLFIEKAIDQLLGEYRFIFNDGSNGYFKKYIDSTNYNQVVSYKGLNDNYINEIPSINLIKPHGSVNWSLFNDKILVNNVVVDNPVVVKPTGIEGQDTFLNNYFHDMLRLFQIELDKQQVILFVIGFSFQDKHIVKMFKRALLNNELIAYIFCFSNEEKETIMNNLGIKKENFNLYILTPNDFEQEYLIENNGEKEEIWYSFTIRSLTNILKVATNE